MRKLTMQQVTDMATAITTSLMQEMNLPESQAESLADVVLKGLLESVPSEIRNVLPLRKN
jgi:hypothetical protein